MWCRRSWGWLYPCDLRPIPLHAHAPSPHTLFPPPYLPHTLPARSAFGPPRGEADRWTAVTCADFP